MRCPSCDHDNRADAKFCDECGAAVRAPAAPRAAAPLAPTPPAPGPAPREHRPADLAGSALQLLTLGVLIVATFSLLGPFLVPSAWAITIVVATWPILLLAQAWLGGRRSLAVTLMTALLLLTLVAPLYLGITAIIGNIDRIEGWSQSLATLTVPPPPAWIDAVPLVGSRLALRWQQLAATRPEELSAHLAPLARTVGLWFAGHVGGVGLLLVQFVLAVIIAAILYANGETAARGAHLFARRLAGRRGETAVDLATQAVRAVALGVMVTAFLQAALSGIGLAVAGIPFAGVLTAVIFVLAVAQVGGGPVLILAVVWLYATRGIPWGTGFLVWAIFCMTLDNVVRPILIRRGADLPLLLIFAGVIGGLIAFGVIGLFIGPVVLAVAYTLLVDWVSEEEAADERGAAVATAAVVPPHEI